ncbi:uncharacterized protein [Rutidosis leptorrhynchoides]|uniref:uncharacterized protein n=1 Tax=Rutidosis leptorrhynchoides TaxID=125765 RepID=UPI003A98F90A
MCRWKASSRMMNIKNTARSSRTDEHPIRSMCSSCDKHLKDSVNNVHSQKTHSSNSNSTGSINSTDVRIYGTKLGLKWKAKTPSQGFGIGSKENKIYWVKKFITKEKPTFLALQETRLKLINLNWIHSLWGSPDCDFIQKERVGMAGRQLIIWDSRYFDASDTIFSDGLIGIRGKWKDSGYKFNLINVHGPHNDVGKVKLWEELSKLIDGCNSGWIICGDFNEVRAQSDRLNYEYIEYRARRFNDFISNNGLMEVPISGRNFTRVSDDGLKFSKIGRFLGTESFYNMWKDLTTVALERKNSDHCPIMMHDEERNFGPKPFKIFDAWFEEEGIEELKNVKGALKEWSMNKFNSLDGEIEALKTLSLNLELKAENNQLSEIEKENWLETRKKWMDKERMKSSMLKQKARIKWILEGDENLKYFHSIIRKEK